VGVLGPVVQAFVAAVLDPGRQLPLRRSIGGELVGHDPPRRPALPPQQRGEEPLGRPLVPAALHDLIQHDPVLVDGAPEPVNLAPDHQPHLVQVPDVARTGCAPADAAGDGRAELGRPPADGLVGDQDPSFEQQLLDEPQAEREAEVEPDGVGDQRSREAVALVGGRVLDHGLADSPIAPTPEPSRLT
jgi:hypothetical protein